MSKPKKEWEAKNVELVPHYVSKTVRKQLLTELAQVIYDLSVRLQKEEDAKKREIKRKGAANE